ncbi:vacuolar protein sorting-associated protein 4A [Rhipicephalus sanguineus]|uniref:vacuolar protein sorting-associated protein 4A n=1 Tax=Rhipicephalus sanguineus TaxID=34632 RepID=UPI001893A316|nr:vacuolar protein sorting-associated protein 4A [Rhipicephalus sanguineus]
MRISIGDLTSDLYELGSNGTPQGSVISPMLFNLIMVGLPKELDKIPGIHHSICADDITIWIGDGSDGYIDQRLQEASALCGEIPRCRPHKSLTRAAAGACPDEDATPPKTPPRPPKLAGTRRRLSVCHPMESVILLNENRGTGSTSSSGAASAEEETLRLEGCLSAERSLLDFVRQYPSQGHTMLLYGASGSAFIYLAKMIAKEDPRWEVHYVRMKQFMGRSIGRDCQRELESLFTEGKDKIKMLFFYLLDTIYGNALAAEEIDYAQRFKTELPEYIKRVASTDKKKLAVVASARKPWLFPNDLQSLFQKWVHVGLPGSAERIRLIKAHIGHVPCSLSDSNFLQLSRMTEDYTYSEIGNMVEEAHLGPFKRIEGATHFKKVDNHWEVCSPRERGAVQLSWHTMKPTDVKEPLVYGDILDGFVKVELRRTDKELAEMETIRLAHLEPKQDNNPSDRARNS